MKRWVMLAALLSSLFLLAGCGDGVAYNNRERMQRQKVIFDNDMKQIIDDYDSFMLNDRPGRLSWWALE